MNLAINVVKGLLITNRLVKSENNQTAFTMYARKLHDSVTRSNNGHGIYRDKIKYACYGSKEFCRNCSQINSYNYIIAKRSFKC